MSRDVRIGITADVSGAVRATDRLGRSMRDLERRNASLRRSLKRGLRSALLPSIAILGAFGYEAVKGAKAASDLAETINKSNVIWGRNADEIRAWAENANDALLMTRQQALDAAANFGGFAKAAGLSGSKAVTFAQDLTQLAADMASFENASPEETIQAIGAALRGETEPIRKYRVLLDDMRLRQAALKLGIVKTTKEALTPQQKTLAAYAEIMRQTTDAQGDLERTADSQANVLKRLQAKWEDLRIELAEALLPAVDAILPKLEELLEWIKKNPGPTKVAIGAITGLAGAIVLLNGAVSAAGAIRAVSTAIGLLAAVIGGGVAALIAGIAAAAVAVAAGFVKLYRESRTFRELVDWIAANVGPAVRWIGEKLAGAFRTLRERVASNGGVMNTVWKALENIGTVLLGVIPLIFKLADRLRLIKSGPVDVLKQAWAGVLSIVQSVISAYDILRGKASIRFPSLPGFGRSIPTATPLLAAPASRSVSSSTTRSGSPTILNVTVNALDAESAARAVKRVLLDHERRHGRLVGGY